jgi:drug/metabolite transporter (DMT)-like permease
MGASLAVLYLVWGSTYLAQRIALADFGPLRMAGLRFATAGVVLYLAMRARGAPAPTGSAWRAAALAGGPMMIVGMGGAAVALERAPSGAAALLFGSVPLWTSLLDCLFGGRLKRLELAGLALGLVGVGLVSARGALRADPAVAALLVASALAYALGCVLRKRLALPAGPLGMAMMMLVAAPPLVAAGTLRGEAFAPTASGALALAYLIGPGTLLGYSALSFLLEKARPALATSYAYVNPIVALMLGALLAGEKFGAADFAALALVLLAVAIVAVAARTAERPPRLTSSPASPNRRAWPSSAPRG